MTTVRLDAGDLSKAIAWATKGVGNKSAEYGLVKIVLAGTNLTLSSFDGEDVFASTIDLVREDHNDTSKKTVYVHGGLLQSVARTMKKDEISLEFEESKISLKIGRGNFAIPLIAARNVPSPPDIPLAFATIQGGALKKAMGQVSTAASGDETMPTLTAVLFEFNPSTGKLRLAATDRFQLAVRDLDVTVLPEREERAEERIRFIVPSKTLKKVVAGLDADEQVTFLMGEGKKGFGLSTSSRSVVLGTYDGDYVAYERLLNFDFAHQVVIDRAEMRQVLGDVTSVSQGKESVLVTITEGEATISLAGGNALVPLDAEGYYEETPIEIIFDPHYLTSVLGCAQSQKISMDFNDSTTKPIVIHEIVDGSVDKSYMHLVMPRRTT